MVLTIKLTSLAWNLYDGLRDHKDELNSSPKMKKILQDRQVFALKRVPNVLEYFGYVYCFPNIMVGPAFEYKEYENNLERSLNAIRSNITPILRAGFTSLLTGLSFLLLYLMIGTKFPLNVVGEASFYETHSYGYCFLYTLAAAYVVRFRFYFAWKVAEAASVLAGFGFLGWDDDGRPLGWRGVANVNIFSIETATCLQHLVRNWNVRTQGWLEKYVYQRSNRSLLLTYVFSSIWHGFYPGFYVFFLCVATMTYLERMIRVTINPFMILNTKLMSSTNNSDVSNVTPKPIFISIYHYVCWFGTTLLFNLAIPYFFLLSPKRCYVYTRGLYYLYPMLIIITSIILYFMNVLMVVTNKKSVTDSGIQKRKGI